MVNEILRFQIELKQSGDFLRACRQAENDLRGSGRCVGYELSRCAEAPEDFILMVGWEAPDRRLQAFRVSRTFEPFFESVRPFSAEILELRHYGRVSLEDRSES